MSADGHRPLDVLMMPDYSEGNPYQRLLADGLAQHDVRVRFETVIGRLPFRNAVRREPRPDVLHVHWHHGYVLGTSRAKTWLKIRRTLLDLRLVRRSRTPIVWTVHNLLEHERRYEAMELGFGARMAGRVDRILVHSESAKRTVVEALGIPPARRDRVAVVEHGSYAGVYPDEIDRPAARAELDLPADASVYLSLGAVRGYKGMTALIGAFRALADPAAVLLVAGKPLDATVERAVCDAAAGDARVRLHLGFVPDERLQVYLRAADAVVLPYTDLLTSGLTLLAMTFGRAVVAPRLGFFEDVLGDAGAVLYDPAEPEGLRAALADAGTADLEALGRRNAAEAARLAWPALAGRVRRVYDDAIEDVRGRSPRRRGAPSGPGAGAGTSRRSR